MLVKGISYLQPGPARELPGASPARGQSGGFLDPIVGTLIVTRVGIAIAAPLGIALASWLSEYGRPSWLARATESAMEMIAGAPSVVLAIFGLIALRARFLGFLSQHAASGTVTGQSFVTAGIVMSLLALPLVFGGHARGARADARRACARPPTRSARPARPRSAACCCRRSGRGCRAGPCWGWAASSATPRSSRSCSAASLRIEQVGGTPRAQRAARHRLDADQLRLQRTPPRAKATRPRRPMRRPSCCC